MTNEERGLISQFVARVGGSSTSSSFSRSVPSTQPALAPIDPEADRFIAEQFTRYPEARYRITQMAVVQEAALAEAGARLQRMQAELDQARQQMQQQQAAPQQGQSRGFFGGLFGGGQNNPPPPQQSPWNQGQPQYAPQQQGYPPGGGYAPQYPPNMQPGMFQRGGGSGFLGSALTTAAGVAGGMVAGNLLMDMFSGHGAGGMGGMGGGGFGGATMPSETTIVNNYGDAASGGWGDASSGAIPGGGAGGGQVDWNDATQSAQPDPSWDDNSGGGWDNSQDSGGGGGFDDNTL